ncbi:hypothetical protein Ais01nite_12080 [Asanoa ishikariensis]|uniref:Uncharacterized protein n=1 Tax=Asanoa ishikariensis TaxID=137265 RepID=A0A1H3T1X2_9ACTN|nr:hypothetical protein [Asanoa ishikariensis]GIF63173.1 hypothetical protein Ais01nite_12080 [Asanoa ishikariensis]SDZ43745.1 hypothetical protein SAMN05421684_5019 [Asanoa ishikariensis]
MNTTDLRQVLDERSSHSAEQVMHHLRLHGVATKVRRRRRRRVATWTACVLVVLGAVSGVALLPRPTPPGPPATHTIEGFPEYARGTRVAAAASADLSVRRVEVTMVPSTLDLTVFTRCDSPADNVVMDMTVTVNNHELTSGSCGGAARWWSWTPELGVAVGKPATFVMTVTGARRSEGEQTVAAAIPATGTFGLALGERIPFDSYPLPPRPAGTLRPLDEHPGTCSQESCPDAVIIRSDPNDPTLPVRRTLTWKPISDIDMVGQTPGFLHLKVNNVEIATGEWWDYELGGHGMYGDQGGQWKDEFRLDPKPGDQVTIEIVPEHQTGEWQVVFRPAD